VLNTPPSIHHDRHLCLVISGSNVISHGYNNVLHAEVAALTKLQHNRGRIINIKVMVIRFDFDLDGNVVVKNSDPCCNCVKFMVRFVEKSKYRITHIMSSTNDNKIKVLPLDAHVAKPYVKTWRIQKT